MKTIYDYLIVMRINWTKSILSNDTRFNMYIIAKRMFLRGEMQ